MSTGYPQNISIKPRDTLFASSFGSETRASSAHIYIDMACDEFSFNRSERDTANGYHGWESYSWLTDIGLDGFVGRQIETPAHAFKGELLNTHWLSQANIKIELQPAPDNYPMHAIECVEPDTWPSALPQCGALLESINMQNVDHYQYLTFSSGRQRRVKKMHGTVSRFSGDVRLSIEEFKTFLDWYRCFLGNGGGMFNASWLVHPEIGAWSGHWAEPWEASFGRGVWTLSVQLILVENTNLDFLSTIPWIIEELIAESEEVILLICEPVTTHLIAQTQEELISATNAKPPLCALVN